VAENEVEWAASNGDDITSIEPDSTGVILIRDDALETTKSGTAVFGGNVTISKFFDIPNGKHGAAAPGSAATSFVLIASDYSTTSPSTTPLTGNPTAIVGAASSFVVGFNASAGTFTLLVAANTTTTATFGYHTRDIWSGTDTTSRRAKVISDSDPAGEWLTISEVASASDPAPNASSRLFRGEVILSSNAAIKGTDNDGVWVQPGDTVTVSYYDSAGNIIDSDTIGVSLPSPTPSVTPTPSPTSTPTLAPIPTPVPGAVTVAENEVRWIKDNGGDITSTEPDSTAVFFIRDDALDTTKSGTAVFSGIPANSKFFDIPNGAAGATAPGTTTGVTRVLIAPGYDTTPPSNTPFSGNPTASVAGASTFVVGADVNAGTFTLLVGANATTTATFGYGHVPDVWDGQQTATRRARVTSTSDPAGEWITISEVNSIGNSTPHATTMLFRGQVVLASNPATQGTSQDGVWVQEGDTVTVTYVDSGGDVIHSDTLGVVIP
jgi:translation initiation factor IF-1